MPNHKGNQPHEARVYKVTSTGNPNNDSSIPSDELLNKLHAPSMDSFGELAVIVMNHLGWTARVFVAKTGYSRKTYYRMQNPKQKSWDISTVLTFCQATRLGFAEAECLFAAAGITLNPWVRADHRAIIFLLENYRGKPATDWNQYLKSREITHLTLRETMTNFTRASPGGDP